MDYIDDLQELYKREELVPFIGSGLSRPFQIPTWEELVKKLSESLEKEFLPSINFYLNKKEILKAIDLLKDFKRYDELELQEKASLLIRKLEKKPLNESEHVYSHLANMSFQLYITTNYDNWLSEYIMTKNRYPVNLYKYENNIADLLKPIDKTVVHLHGNLADQSTMVFSEKSYMKRYEDERYTKLIEAISSSKTFLFMGFSFDDWYIKNLFEQYNKYFKKPHYILLDKPSEETYSRLKNDYKLRVIPYDAQKSSHTVEIKRVLNSIQSSEVLSPEAIQTEWKVGNWIRINPGNNDWLSTIKKGKNLKAIYEHISKKNYFSIKEGEYVCFYTKDGVHLLGKVDFHTSLTIDEILNYEGHRNIGFTKVELINFKKNNFEEIEGEILCTGFTIIESYNVPMSIDKYSEKYKMSMPRDKYAISSFNK